ncbi:MAG TPA: TonB-dependent receptor [Thermoanaerobaculia bacterium]|nr:TonB-dependent receptor [Thermoanaerobaculia bacterium]
MSRKMQQFLFTLFIATFALQGLAQSTTATIRGRVTNERGAPIAGAEVSAVNSATGFVVTVRSRGDGSYQLGGVQPGEVNIVVAAPGYEPRSQTLVLRVGQNVDVDLALSATAVVTESITVVGNQVAETRTPEIATNVTPQQMEALPQDDRNFLNFAALAPGIRLSPDPQRKTFAGDAQPAESTNIFIDGISFKNDVLKGGAAGQDASRGNPFPQNAVQEFRVITQNYSAQYDKASSAIITAVTKSGGNHLDGQAFLFYQPKEWVAATAKGFQFSTLSTNESYKRYQSGFSAGGPIIRDRLHFFLAWEGDQEDAVKTVSIGNSNFTQAFAQYLGSGGSPFRSNLAFGKISWQPATNQLVDVSTNYRREHEIRDFGDKIAFESATDLRNWVYGGTLRHQWNNDRALNQAALALQTYGWNPRPVNPDLVGLNFEGVLRIGGNTTTQEFEQRRLELRDDYNLTGFTRMGDHNFQLGGNLDFLDYKVNKSLNGNPQYNFKIDPNNGYSFATPYQAIYGFGNPRFNTSNREYGIYGQDNWTINDRLTVNLGLRWDYETDMIDAGYVTPANIAAGLAGKVDPSYFSSGDDRESYKGEIQPRLGFSYDLTGNGRAVLFGGAGRYYDRLFLNATLDERFRLQFPVYRIEFAAPGRTPNPGQVVWDPKYLTKAGLDQLIATGVTKPEIFLLNNDTKPPYSNQFNLGVRGIWSGWQGSLSYNMVRGYRGFTWLSATGLCCSELVSGFGNVLISDPAGKRYWYDGIYLTLDRPYTSQTNWGARVSYTHSDAKQTGNDEFSLDFPSAAAYPKHTVPGTEPNHLVAVGIVGLPWDTRLSTTITLGSGGAANFLDFHLGFSLQNRIDSNAYAGTLYPQKTNGFGYQSLDFRLEKVFNVGRFGLGVIGEIFNATNANNYGCTNNFLGPDPQGNPDLGNPGCVVSLGRREQLGLRVRF